MELDLSPLRLNVGVSNIGLTQAWSQSGMGLKTEDKDKYADLYEIEELENLEVAGNSDGGRYRAWADLTFLITAPFPLPTEKHQCVGETSQTNSNEAKKKRKRKRKIPDAQE